MFLVCTGAAAGDPVGAERGGRVDGASRRASTYPDHFPLMLVGMAPLMVASFAFNFNNYNTIWLLTEGGPFAAGQPDRGRHRHPDQLHHAPGVRRQGAQIGFASAVSVVLFVITGVIAALQFRATKKLEEMN